MKFRPLIMCNNPSRNIRVVITDISSFDIFNPKSSKGFSKSNIPFLIVFSNFLSCWLYWPFPRTMKISKLQQWASLCTPVRYCPFMLNFQMSKFLSYHLQVRKQICFVWDNHSQNILRLALLIWKWLKECLVLNFPNIDGREQLDFIRHPQKFVKTQFKGLNHWQEVKIKSQNKTKTYFTRHFKYFNLTRCNKIKSQSQRFKSQIHRSNS